MVTYYLCSKWVSLFFWAGLGWVGYCMVLYGYHGTTRRNCCCMACTAFAFAQPRAPRRAWDVGKASCYCSGARACESCWCSHRITIVSTTPSFTSFQVVVPTTPLCGRKAKRGKERHNTMHPWQYSTVQHIAVGLGVGGCRT